MKNQNPDFSVLLIKIRNLGFLTILAIGVVLIIVNLISHVSLTDDENDIRNWISLVIEIGLATFIALTILIYENMRQNSFKLQQNTIEKLVTNIEKIEKEQQERIQEQKSFLDRRRNFSFVLNDSNLQMIDYHITRIDELVKDLKDDQKNRIKIEKEIQYNLDEKNYYVNQIELVVNLSSDVLDPAFVLEILNVCRMAKLYVLYEKDSDPFNFPNITSIIKSIEKVRSELPKFF